MTPLLVYGVFLVMSGCLTMALLWILMLYERRRKPAPPPAVRETPEETAAAMKQNQEEWQAMMRNLQGLPPNVQSMVDRMTDRSEYRPPFSEDAPAPAAVATPGGINIPTGVCTGIEAPTPELIARLKPATPKPDSYEVIDPTGEGFWQVVDISNREPHKKTILNEDGQNVEIHCYTRKDPSKPLVRVVASYTPYMPEAWEEAHNLCHKLNGGQL